MPHLLLALVLATEPEGWLTLAGEVSLQTEDEVEIWLDYLEADGTGAYGNHFEIRKGKLAADGTFRFDKLLPGIYTVHVRGKKHAYFEHEWLELAESRRDFALALPLGCVLKGKAPPGADVTAYPVDADWSRSTKADATGAYALERLAPGKYHVNVFNGEIGRFFRVTIRPGGQKRDFRVVPDAPVQFSVTLPDGVDRVHGRLAYVDFWYDESREFIAKRRDGKVMITPVPRNLAVTKPELVIRQFAPGTHKFRLEVPGFRKEDRTVRFTTELNRLHFELKPRVGQYIHARIQSLLWTIDVRRANGKGPWQTMLWRDARAPISHAPIPGETLGFLPPGRYVARVRSDRFVEARLPEFEIKDDRSTVELRCPLLKGATVRGRVLTPAGAALQSGQFHVFRRHGKEWVRLPHKFTGIVDGKFAIAGLGRGRYRFAYTEKGDAILGEADAGDRDVTLDLRFQRAK